MKALICAVALLFISTICLCQHIYPIRADSVRIYSNCDTAELIIENRTKDTLGFLYNKGKGRTEFRKLRLKAINGTSIAIVGQDTLQLGTIIKTTVDTIYQSNGTLYYRKTNGVVVQLPITTTETLATVTNRASTTTQNITFNAATANPSNGVVWGYNTDTFKIFVESLQDSPSGNMIFQTADNDDEGWIFRSSTSAAKTDVLSLSKNRFLYNGNTVYHSGNVTFDTMGVNIALKTNAKGYLGVGNWIRAGNNTGFYTSDGAFLYRNNTQSWALRSGSTSTAVWLELQTADGVNRGGFYSDGATGNLGVVNAAANGWRMRMDASSNMYVTGLVYATGFYQNSLRSLKRDIKPFEGQALKILNATSVRTFIYKADSANVKHIGFIADEIPEEMAAPGRQGVDQANTVALLVKALQEMSAKVEALERKVELLEKK